MRQNKLNLSGTGGGPNRQKFYSDNEKFVMAILDLNEAVAGNNNSLHFGHPSAEDNEPSPNIAESLYTPPIDGEVLEVEQSGPEVTIPSKPTTEKKRKNSNSLSEKHVNLQEDVISMLQESLTSMESSQKEILKEMKKMNSWNKENDRWSKKNYQLQRSHKNITFFVYNSEHSCGSKYFLFLLLYSTFY